MELVLCGLGDGFGIWGWCLGFGILEFEFWIWDLSVSKTRERWVLSAFWVRNASYGA